MDALRVLRQFVLIKSAEGRSNEIRGYVTGQLSRFSKAFHVEPEVLRNALASVSDDEALARKLLETIARAEHILRQERKMKRAREAQATASTLAKAAQWKGERAMLDMPSLLLCALTRRNDLLVFISADHFTVSVYMGPLLDLARIARARVSMTGWVDNHGLHIRWATGGLNLRSQDDAKGDRIVLFLPPMSSIIAA